MQNETRANTTREPWEPSPWRHRLQLDLVEKTKTDCPDCRGLEHCVMDGYRGYMSRYNEPGSKSIGYAAFEVWPCPHFMMASVDRHLGKRFARRQQGTFRVNAGNQEAFYESKAYAGSYVPGETSTGLLYTGGAGAGKTHLAAGVLREIVRRGEYRFRWLHVPAHHDEKLEEYSHIRLLVLDDLTGTGIEKGWKGSAFRRSLYVLINRRYEAEAPTIITCNMGMEEMKDALGRDLAGRMVEMCGGAPVKLKGPSWRSGV